MASDTPLTQTVRTIVVQGHSYSAMRLYEAMWEFYFSAGVCAVRNERGCSSGERLVVSMGLRMDEGGRFNGGWGRNTWCGLVEGVWIEIRFGGSGWLMPGCTADSGRKHWRHSLFRRGRNLIDRNIAWMMAALSQRVNSVGLNQSKELLNAIRHVHTGKGSLSPDCLLSLNTAIALRT